MSGGLQFGEGTNSRLLDENGTLFLFVLSKGDLRILFHFLKSLSSAAGVGVVEDLFPSYF